MTVEKNLIANFINRGSRKRSGKKVKIRQMNLQASKNVIASSFLTKDFISFSAARLSKFTLPILLLCNSWLQNYLLPLYLFYYAYSHYSSIYFPSFFHPSDILFLKPWTLIQRSLLVKILISSDLLNYIRTDFYYNCILNLHFLWGRVFCFVLFCFVCLFCFRCVLGGFLLLIFFSILV